MAQEFVVREKMRLLNENNKGCVCKASGCMKKYCHCYAKRIPCKDNCKCVGCRNTEADFTAQGDALYDKIQEPKPKTRRLPRNTKQTNQLGSSNSTKVKKDSTIAKELPSSSDQSIVFKKPIRIPGRPSKRGIAICRPFDVIKPLHKINPSTNPAVAKFRSNQQRIKLSQTGANLPTTVTPIATVTKRAKDDPIITESYLDFTVNRLSGQISESVKIGLSEDQAERMVIREFGRCISDLCKAFDATEPIGTDLTLLGKK